MGRFIRLGILVAAAGCAGPAVRPGDLPPRPVLDGAPAVWLVTDATPAPMAAEAREIAGRLPGWRQVSLAPGNPLVAACDGRDGVAIRPSLRQIHFLSNTHDRNVFLIYESAVVAGIPVALISLAAWPWDGETTAEGQLEVAPCDGSAPSPALVESFRLRSGGRGLITEDRLRAEQADAVLRGVTRKLLAVFDRTRR